VRHYFNRKNGNKSQGTYPYAELNTVPIDKRDY